MTGRMTAHMTALCFAQNDRASAPRFILGRAFVIAAIMALFLTGPVRAAGATDTIEHFHAGLVDALKKTNGKGFDARRDALKPVIETSFDSGFMAKVASGSTWDTLSETQRADLTKAFQNMTIANYASRFKSYNGQSFVVTGSEAAPNDRALVHTQLNRKKGDPVRIDYVLHKTPISPVPTPPADKSAKAKGKAKTAATPAKSARPEWTIMDVRLNGSVSELALRRSEFAPVLRDKGFDALLAVLKQKTADLASAPSDVDAGAATP